MLTHHEGVDVIYGLAVKGVYPSAVHAARYFHGLCELVNDAYQLGIEARLQALSRTLAEAAHEVLIAHPELLA